MGNTKTSSILYSHLPLKWILNGHSKCWSQLGPETKWRKKMFSEWPKWVVFKWTFTKRSSVLRWKFDSDRIHGRGTYRKGMFTKPGERHSLRLSPNIVLGVYVIKRLLNPLFGWFRQYPIKQKLFTFPLKEIY